MTQSVITSGVAQFLAAKLGQVDKSQTEVARSCGYDKPNIISMFKQGTTKLPINKVGVMAAALGVDPIYLLRIAMEEYLPDSWQAVQDIAGRELITQAEFELIRELRRETAGREIRIETGQQRKALHELASALKGDSV